MDDNTLRGSQSPGEGTTTYIQTEYLVINEDKLIRILDIHEQQERQRPRADAVLAMAGMLVTFLFVLGTSDFHGAGPISGGDFHTIALVGLVLTALATVRMGWRYIDHLRGFRPLTAEDRVAEVKVAQVKKVQQDLEERQRAAAARLSAHE